MRALIRSRIRLPSGLKARPWLRLRYGPPMLRLADPFHPLSATPLVIRPMRRFSSFAALMVLVIIPARAEQPSRYTDAMFRAALENHSTAPNYVLVTIRDGRDGSSRLVCVEAPFLEGALHREHALDYSESGERRVQQLLTNPNRVYTLSQPAALANVAPRYSPQVLTEVRSILFSRSDAQLRSASLDWLYVSKSSESYSAYRDAVAHVLLERGILCGRGCVVGNLYVNQR